MIAGINQTSLNQSSRCPEQHRRFIVDGPLPPPIAAIGGTAVHKAAQINHHYIKDTGKPLLKEDILDATATAFKEILKEGVSLTKEEALNKDNVLGQMKDQAISLAGLYADKVSPLIDKPIIIEEKIELDVGFKVPLFGTIDLLHKSNQILDLKTSAKRKPESFGVGNLQATQYTMLVRSVIEEQPEFEFRILIANKTPVEQTIKAVVRDTDEIALLNRARALLRMWETGLFPPANPDSWYCSEAWCGYWSTCPYVGHPISIQVNGGKK